MAKRIMHRFIRTCNDLQGIANGFKLAHLNRALDGEAPDFVVVTANLVHRSRARSNSQLKGWGKPTEGSVATGSWQRGHLDHGSEVIWIMAARSSWASTSAKT
jgi:hypothetical protein